MLVPVTMGDHPVAQEVQNFDSSKLKKVETQEKNTRPTTEDIEAEKKAIQEGSG
uniref:Thymosin beta n=1 Tax=Mola mola TaxID=94237 RepID=A0A3Q3WAH8_MOLML